MASKPHATPVRNILYVTPECAPLVKTGGLGDVSAALPPALRETGLDVRVLMPGYPAVLSANAAAAELARFKVLGHSVRLLDGRLPSGVPLLILDCPELYDRGGGPYQADDGDDWEDNALRFGVLSRAAALLGSAASPLLAENFLEASPSAEAAVPFRPDVVHCHDWPAALAPVYLHFDRGPHAASLVTIHNLAFQGVFPSERFRGLELPPESLGLSGLEFYGKYSFLKGGLVYADAINTVSPTYAREIQGEELGFGLDGVLKLRRGVLHGVLNGIDTVLWNPQADPFIPTRYGPLTIEKKLENKLAFKHRMGLKGPSDVPVLGMVSRLTHQKGIDLLLAGAEAITAMGAQLAIIGTGDRELTEKLRAMKDKLGDRMAIFIGFDEGFAHLLEAGADAFLMPSRFEPCGMNQMYSQRYGTPPIANSTGGLVDTITDAAMGIGNTPATGFLMPEASTQALVDTVQRAITAYREPRAWRSLQLNGMAKDFGWAAAAKQYRAIYERLTSGSDPNLT